MVSQSRGGRTLDQGEIQDVLMRNSQIMPQAAWNAACARGIPAKRVPDFPGLVEYGNGSLRHRMLGVVSDQSKTIGMRFARDKVRTKFLLQRAGLPVPPGAVVSSLNDALDIAQTLGYPVVLKPPDSSHTRGVHNDIQNDDELTEHFLDALETSPSRRVLIETVVLGIQFRASIIDHNVVRVHEKRLPRVVGDGHHTVQELVDLENADPSRAGDRSLYRQPIRIDEMTSRLLARKHLTMDSVLERGRSVDLQTFPLLQNGATSIDCTSAIHPDNRAMLEQASRVLDLPVSTADFITADVGRSMLLENGAILEFNGESVFSSGYTVTEGPVCDFGAMFIEMRFPSNATGRIPIVTVTQSSSSSSLCHSIADSVAVEGTKAGISSHDGITIDDMCFSRLDSDGLYGLQILLSNPAVEVAIVEIPKNDLETLSSRLDYCDLVVIPQLSGATTSAGQPIETTLCDLTVSSGGQIMLNSEDPDARNFGARYMAETVIFEHIA